MICTNLIGHFDVIADNGGPDRGPDNSSRGSRESVAIYTTEEGSVRDHQIEHAAKVNSDTEDSEEGNELGVMLETGTKLKDASSVRYNANGVVFGVQASSAFALRVLRVKFGSGRSYADYNATIYLFLGDGTPTQDDICDREQWETAGVFKVDNMVAKAVQEIRVKDANVQPGHTLWLHLHTIPGKAHALS